jgi:hypothetical protein
MNGDAFVLPGGRKVTPNDDISGKYFKKRRQNTTIGCCSGATPLRDRYFEVILG